jgi:hypothetical protein
METGLEPFGPGLDLRVTRQDPLDLVPKNIAANKSNHGVLPRWPSEVADGQFSFDFFGGLGHQWGFGLLFFFKYTTNGSGER